MSMKTREQESVLTLAAATHAVSPRCKALPQPQLQAVGF